MATGKNSAPAGAPSRTDSLLTELLHAICMIAVAAKAMEDTEDHAEERHVLKDAVDRLYRVHDELDSDATEAAHLQRVGSADQVLQ